MSHIVVSPEKVHLKSALVGSRHELLLLPPPPPPPPTSANIQACRWEVGTKRIRSEEPVVCRLSLHMGRYCAALVPYTGKCYWFEDGTRYSRQMDTCSTNGGVFGGCSSTSLGIDNRTLADERQLVFGSRELCDRADALGRVRVNRSNIPSAESSRSIKQYRLQGRRYRLQDFFTGTGF